MALSMLVRFWARQFPDLGVRVMARGHTRTFDQLSVTPETETFRLTGTLETPDPGCTLLKLGLGEVTQGMSGAPVLAAAHGGGDRDAADQPAAWLESGRMGGACGPDPPAVAGRGRPA